MYKTVLFDLDGTLLNTIDDLADSANHVCTAHGWPTHTVEEYKHFVGHGMRNLVICFSPENARSETQLNATLAEFMDWYGQHKEDKTAPYPGIPQLIARLRELGVATAVFSNKENTLCQGVIEHYLPGLFDRVRGQLPNVPIKPDPAGLLSLMDELGATPDTTLFVGDSDVDILTGHNAGLPACGVLWGFRSKAELTGAGADFLAADPESLLRLIQKEG